MVYAKKAIDVARPIEGPEREADFLSILNPNKGIIYKASRPFCRNKDEREDLYYEVVIALWNAFPDFRNECKPSTWMYKIAFRTSLLFWEKSQRVKLEYTEAIEEFADGDENAGAREQVAEVMQRLDPVERAIATLIMEDYVRKEIGEILEISENAVNSRMKRVKARLSR